MRRALLAIVALLPSACGLVLDWDDRSFGGDGGTPATETGVPPNDTGLPPPRKDADDEDDAASSEEGGTCPNGMIRAGSFCIDATEVTNGAYASFLVSDAGTQHPACTWKTTFKPDNWEPSAPKNLPVVNVDWCDAVAFCEWAGKRLCGAIGGGGAAWNAPKEGQWYTACSKSDTQSYPYGGVYRVDACVTEVNDPVAVGSRPSCEGGFTGLFDMSGNVGEWEDSCSGFGPSTSCSIRGGDFESNASHAACAFRNAMPRDKVDDHVGFRCCGP